MSELNTGDAAAFVSDEHEKHSPLASEAYRALKLHNPVAERYLGSFSVSDDRKCEPLQAADAVVFEIRKALRLSLKESTGNAPKAVQYPFGHQEGVRDSIRQSSESSSNCQNSQTG